MIVSRSVSAVAIGRPNRTMRSHSSSSDDKNTARCSATGSSERRSETRYSLKRYVHASKSRREQEDGSRGTGRAGRRRAGPLLPSAPVPGRWVAGLCGTADASGAMRRVIRTVICCCC